MTSPTDIPISVNGSIGGKLASESNSKWLENLGAELAFTHDVSGLYRAFYWQRADRYGIDPEQLVGTQINSLFKPLTIAPYLERVRRVLESKIPERFTYPFCWGDRCFVFDLAVSPIMKGSAVTEVLVMGHLEPCLPSPTEGESGEASPESFLSLRLTGRQKLLGQILGSIRRTLPPGSELYQKLLGKIARNIRRSLNLENIWQETVKGLGESLGVSRCIICSYKSDWPTVRVVASYTQEPYPSMLGWELSLASEPYLSKALETRSPVMVEESPEDDGEKASGETHSLLAIAARYQEIPNALICLYQCDRQRSWNLGEIELIQEIAEQVGTEIAHANLTQELQQARQKAEEISDLKSQFLATTSHELRTPLNSTIGFLKLILDGMAETPEEEREFALESYQSAIHLLNLIDDILDIAKIEADKLEIDLEPVDLSEIMTIVKNKTRTQVQEKGLSLEIEPIATVREAIVCANHQRLVQVFLNLVGNAIKFTHIGSITIATEIIANQNLRDNNAENGREVPAMVAIRVTDTGIGVAVEEQDKLFKPFSQVDGSSTREYGGTGLGLVISQKLVEAMGGRIDFYSQGKEMGSTVTFTVPLYNEDDFFDDEFN